MVCRRRWQQQQPCSDASSNKPQTQQQPQQPQQQQTQQTQHISSPDTLPATRLGSLSGVWRSSSSSSTLISTADEVVKPVGRSAGSLLLQLTHKNDRSQSGSSTASAAAVSSTTSSTSSSNSSGGGGLAEAQLLLDQGSNVNVLHLGKTEEVNKDKNSRTGTVSGGGSSSKLTASTIASRPACLEGAPATSAAAMTSAVDSLWLTAAPAGPLDTHSSADTIATMVSCSSNSSGPASWANFIHGSGLQPGCAAGTPCCTISSTMTANTAPFSSVHSPCNTLLLQNLLISSENGIAGVSAGPSAAGGILNYSDSAAAATPVSALLSPPRQAPVSMLASPHMLCNSNMSSSSSIGTPGADPVHTLAAAAAARAAAGEPHISSVPDTARCLNLNSTGTIYGAIPTSFAPGSIDLQISSQLAAAVSYCPRCGGLHVGKCPPKAKCVRCYRKAHLGECWTRCISCNLVHAPGKCKNLQTRQQQQQQHLDPRTDQQSSMCR